MFHVALFQPEIPPNTGNIIRLCANSGARLHLIQPLGFELDDRRLRRAGLDYHEWTSLRLYENFSAFLEQQTGRRIFAFSTKGEVCYSDIVYCPGDTLLFGPETRGLPVDILARLPAGRRLRVPMRPHNRSLNLSNAVAVVLYEAWRQQGFAGGG